MDERREDPAAPGSHPPIPATMLPTAQQAHVDYTGHVVGCDRCRDIDRDRCNEGGRLWRIWTEACDDAYRQLNPGRP